MFLRNYVVAAIVVLIGVTLRSFALVTSATALLVAGFALWQARTAIRTVHQDVLPKLRALTGDEDAGAT